MDFSWKPYHSLADHDSAPIPFSDIGVDVVISKPKGYRPPSRQVASNRPSAVAATEHLRQKEKEKLARLGMGTKGSSTFITGEQIIGNLLDNDKVLIPMAISPYGRMGHMWEIFIFGHDPNNPDHAPIKFFHTRPNAQAMYNRATSYPTPIGLADLAQSRWTETKSPRQHFFGNSYTAPTATAYAQQQLGLVISDAIAYHLRDAKQGTLKPACPEEEGENTQDDMVLDDSDIDHHATFHSMLFPPPSKHPTNSPSISTLLAQALPPLPPPTPATPHGTIHLDISSHHYSWDASYLSRLQQLPDFGLDFSLNLDTPSDVNYESLSEHTDRVAAV